MFSASLALALFGHDTATAQEVRQIKVSEKQIQSFMAAYEDIAKVYDGAESDKPEDPKVEVQAAAVAGLGSRTPSGPAVHPDCVNRPDT